MSDPVQITDVPPQRLCCEIQLFELCDLCSCTDKNGRFCTNPDLLGRFEKIAEEELRVPERYLSEEDDDAYDDYAYDEDDEVGEDGCDEDGAGWEDEE
ncbi:MAG TPA: hypothetical protein VN642_10210 [Dongiaceae bacterium]|nr:hypothetical protein [Dongiaceae bacterium]